MPDDAGLIHDPWDQLKPLTAARIALGRAGGSLPMREVLDFSLAHARARDAVHCEFEPDRLARDLEQLGVTTLQLASAAESRLDYLRRPDLGRRLSPASDKILRDPATCGPKPDLVLIVSDGLSALAAHTQTRPFLEALLPLLHQDGWKLGPVLLVRHGRVGIQDEIGTALGAPLAVILLGERPGLRAPDSLGAYLVYNPGPHCTDADRNCISNIRPEGLPPDEAARTLHYLLTESRRRKLSGVALKDERSGVALPQPHADRLK